MLPGAADRAAAAPSCSSAGTPSPPGWPPCSATSPPAPSPRRSCATCREPVAPDEAAMAELATELNFAASPSVGPPFEPRRPRPAGPLLPVRAGHRRRAPHRDRHGAAPPSTTPSPPSAPLESGASRRCRRWCRCPSGPAARSRHRPKDDDQAAQAVTLREARWAEVEAARAAVAEAEATVADHRQATDVARGAGGRLARCGSRRRRPPLRSPQPRPSGPGQRPRVRRGGRHRAPRPRPRCARSTRPRGGRARRAADAGRRHRRRGHDAGRRGARHQRRAARHRGCRRRADHGGIARRGRCRVRQGHRHEEQATADAAGIDRSKLVDDVDWELMSRLAALRSVGLAGSVPLVLDDPFAVARRRRADLGAGPPGPPGRRRAGGAGHRSRGRGGLGRPDRLREGPRSTRAEPPATRSWCPWPGGGSRRSRPSAWSRPSKPLVLANLPGSSAL